MMPAFTHSDSDFYHLAGTSSCVVSYNDEIPPVAARPAPAILAVYTSSDDEATLPSSGFLASGLADIRKTLKPVRV